MRYNRDMETEPVSSSAVLHSFKEDSVRQAQHIVGSDAVPKEEALLLASMHAAAKKTRRQNFLAIAGILFVAIALVLVFAPLKKTEEPDLNEVSPVSSIIRANASYAITLPNESELGTFRSQSFAGAPGISSIEIRKNGQAVSFFQLVPLLPERLLKNFETARVTDYLYGLYTPEGSASLPFLIIQTDNHEALAGALRTEERTLYTDLGTLFHLPTNPENETRQFESNDSVRSPVRFIQTAEGNALLVYGFPREDILIITVSFDAYAAVRERALLGY